MENCKKCWFLKMTPNSKCACNVKKFNEAKLSKKTRVEKKPKAIAKVSEKKKKSDKARWNVSLLFQKIAKKRLDKGGNWVCEYCSKPFNIKYDVINQTVCFAHILSKWNVDFKHLAMFENNIALVCSETCHKELDAEICVLWIKKELQSRIERLEKIDVWDLNQYII